MQLRVARLCLDCEEIHSEQQCPVCGSESFAFISRWIAAPERRTSPRPPASTGDAETYRQLLTPSRPEPSRMRWLKRGAFGLAAVALARTAWRRSSPENTGAGRPSGTKDSSEP